MFKFEATVLLITLAGQITAENSTDLPTFECIPGGHYTECTIFNPITSQTNPNFEISHPRPHEINVVKVVEGSLVVFTRDICDYFTDLYYINLKYAGVKELEENALATCKKLVKWYFEGGKVEKIPLKFFKNNPQIKEIHFYDTPIKKIDPTQFHGLMELNALGIAMTQIEEFPLESISSDWMFWFLVYSNNLKDFPAEEYLKKFTGTIYVAYGDNDINCSRVQEMNGLFEERGITVSNFNWPKPREEVIGEAGGVICVPL